MRTRAAQWSLMLLCFSMAGAVGGGLYEHIVLMPLWAASPPSSLAMIQPGTGVPLQEFWIPVHVAITVFLLLSLVLAWKERKARRFLCAILGGRRSSASPAASDMSSARRPDPRRSPMALVHRTHAISPSRRCSAAVVCGGRILPPRVASWREVA
jgi:hypothetical protein